MKRFFSLPLLIGAALLITQGCSDPVSSDISAKSVDSQFEAAAQDAGTLSKRGRAAGQQSGTIVDVALSVNQQSGEFSILIEALQRADLVGALQAKRQLTVFAPTDAAFVALLGELGATSLDDIDDATLSAVLLYHVVPGRRFSNSVLRSNRINTLNGGFVFVERGEATLIDANGRESNILVDAGLFDIPAGNGVIHVIDRVLLP